MTSRLPVASVGHQPRCGDLATHLIEYLRCFRATDAGNVVLVFEQYAERVLDRLRRQLDDIKLMQGGSPVDCLGDAGKLEQVHFAQLLDERDDLATELFVRLRRLDPEDFQLALDVGIIDPVIEAAPLERVVNFARAVRGDDDDWRLVSLLGADFRNGDLEVGQHFEKIGLERLVGTVELVDQQYWRSFERRFESLQQRSLDQETVGEDIAAELVAVLDALGLGHTNLDHLRRVVPLVDGRGDVETLIALQAQQLAAERIGEHLGDFGLADAGLAFEEQRPSELQRQMHGGCQTAVGDIVAPRQQVDRGVDRIGYFFQLLDLWLREIGTG